MKLKSRGWWELHPINFQTAGGWKSEFYGLAGDLCCSEVHNKTTRNVSRVNLIGEFEWMLAKVEIRWVGWDTGCGVSAIWHRMSGHGDHTLSLCCHKDLQIILYFLKVTWWLLWHYSLTCSNILKFKKEICTLTHQPYLHITAQQLSVISLDGFVGDILMKVHLSPRSEIARWPCWQSGKRPYYQIVWCQLQIFHCLW